MATGFVFLVFLLAMAKHSNGNWCICKDGLGDPTLQKTLDYACGAGADCNPVRSTGPCYNPNTVRAHCSYAVNSYFQKNRQSPEACVFSGTATIITSDPSAAGCNYPATASPTTTSPVTTVGGGTTMPKGGPPLVTTTSPGVLGGPNSGLSPTGINTDMSNANILLRKATIFFASIMLAFSGPIFLWG